MLFTRFRARFPGRGPRRTAAGSYATARNARWTCLMVSGRTPGVLFKTRDTVAMETPARFATSTSDMNLPFRCKNSLDNENIN
jgi:hypothetical protein